MRTPKRLILSTLLVATTLATTGCADFLDWVVIGELDTNLQGETKDFTIADLTVADLDYSQPYERTNQFGEAWIDTDNNGCDTRNDILARDLTEITTKGLCTVLTGNLVDSYTGIPQPFTRGEETSWLVQIDHVVSLSNAWRSGANKLSQDERIDLANDPLNLRSINGELNQEKSDLPADKWLPPLQSAQCDYVQTQIEVKGKYELTITPAEKTAMQTVLDGCDTVNG